jgi:uncharacterized protein YpmS
MVWQLLSGVFGLTTLIFAYLYIRTLKHNISLKSSNPHTSSLIPTTRSDINETVEKILDDVAAIKKNA